MSESPMFNVFVMAPGERPELVYGPCVGDEARAFVSEWLDDPVGCPVMVSPVEVTFIEPSLLKKQARKKQSKSKPPLKSGELNSV